MDRLSYCGNECPIGRAEISGLGIDHKRDNSLYAIAKSWHDLVVRHKNHLFVWKPPNWFLRTIHMNLIVKGIIIDLSSSVCLAPICEPLFCLIWKFGHWNLDLRRPNSPPLFLNNLINFLKKQQGKVSGKALTYTKAILSHPLHTVIWNNWKLLAFRF